ncbi:MAG TPA: Stp1/IreP family PP2C-type Ser/Thr phosphatase [Rhodothermales bacterium]|nr:Stp1/IreP family PP2C-type Ser/Thr phosphatase [Rhodothermales bacterium]
MFARWKKSRQESPKKERDTRSRRVLPAYEPVVCVQTDVGCHREINEDHARYIKPADPDLVARKGTLLIVADGMGGHAAGEVASQLAVDIISHRYYQSRHEPRRALKEAFEEANRVIHKQAREHAIQNGMGTTATVLVLQHGEVLFAHVGDSRLYLIRDGHLYTLSEDHSLVMEMVRQGLITATEARNHEDKNVILRALGTKPEVDVAVAPAPLEVQPSDQFLVCSDGLYDMVPDEEILVIMLDAEPHTACENLIALAKKRGGHDNITVGLVRLVPDAEADRAGSARDTREVKALPGDAPRPTREVKPLDR